MGDRAFKNYIGGEWVDAGSRESFESRNPADTSDLVGVFARSMAADVDRAVQAAASALAERRRSSAADRAECIFAVAESIEERRDEFAAAVTREIGAPLSEARAEVASTVRLARTLPKDCIAALEGGVPRGLDSQTTFPVRAAMGVVGILSPWSSPLGVAVRKIAAALVAGCTVVLKPAEDAPLCAALLIEAFDEAGLAPGALNLVTGFGEEAGTALVEHPAVHAISFTGSLEIGRMVNEKCARGFKRVSLDLGSKDALIVLPDADLERAVDGAVLGGFATSGQRRHAISRLIVHEEIRPHFTDLLLDRVAKLKLGNGIEPDTDVGPVINEQQKNRVLEYIGLGRQEGANVLLGGELPIGDEYENGHFILPTVFDEMTPTMRVAREEVFGPVTGIVPVSTFDEAIAAANSVEQRVSCSVYTGDIASIVSAAQRLEFGFIAANSPTVGIEDRPASGATVLDEFTKTKTVLIADPRESGRVDEWG
ncbi:MAG: aldehyde dehydrogenase family protein [Actinomycetota bacterium]